ncbi:MAG TPA: S8 family peptidase [Candidatus Binatia bacterium]|jgi:subtilisin family serine protease
MKKFALLSVAAAFVAFCLVAFARDARVQTRLPNDPYLYSKGSWGQSYQDQWGHWKVGLTPMEAGKSAWDIETGEKNPVTIAVIDSGLDYVHPEIAKKNVWVNTKEIPGNGIDDDNNGYVDDVMGWNFMENNNNPWDNDGHGTFTAGIIAATSNNSEGIAGINRGVKIMPLRALNFLGRGSISHIVKSLVYAADNGARIVNISIEQLETDKSKALQWAVDYAYKKGVTVIVAAGNQGRDTASLSPGGLEHVITVAATDHDDKRMGFSNWGRYIKLSAPGEEILSLRARKTDLLVMSGSKEYNAGRAFLGGDARYYHATGTSFASPFVAGAASLLLAKNPNLKFEQIEHMLLMSADDVETPGWDQLTGYGRLNIRKALEADPDYYLYSELHRVTPAREDGKTVIQVFGTAKASQWGSYRIEIGEGDNPTQWRRAGRLAGGQVTNGLLATLTQADFGRNGQWNIRLVAEDSARKTRESRQPVTLQ